VATITTTGDITDGGALTTTNAITDNSTLSATAITATSLAATAAVSGTTLTGTTALNVLGANGQISQYQQATVLLATTSGASTVTAASLIPAGSIVWAVDTRVTTILTGAALTTWKAGDGTTTNAFANTQALSVGTISNLTNHLSTWKPTLYVSATGVVLTANAGVFTTGAVRITVHYFTLTAATS
jgi:hypothetical protein